MLQAGDAKPAGTHPHFLVEVMIKVNVWFPCSAVLRRCSIGWGGGRCTCVGAQWLDNAWLHCVVLCSYAAGSGMVAYRLSQVVFQTNLV
ncbi:hypothetical protein Nepgr_033530 [Nepenthes gracilis]|uniref:Uncharacterized protein n=1 Tax=Nepenthes gracilis TaxID=150966 RepID=A0AAD3TM59_NEPGR|nr:hypothetical protein Nepgr_033530 [Nepenthes gracilis]